MKKKLDWIKLECQNNDAMDLIESELGLKGFAVIVKLRQRIGGSEGYYCEWNKDVELVFAKRNGVGADFVSEVIQAGIRRGIFDSNMFENYGILTSYEIQEGYEELSSRRKYSKIKPEYLLLNCAQNSENADISSENADISKENAYIPDTEEKRIEKNRIDENRGEESVPDSPLRTYGEFGHIKLTDEQYQKLVQQYGESNIKSYIRKMDDWLEAKKLTFDNYYVRLRRWLDKDGVKQISGRKNYYGEDEAL